MDDRAAWVERTAAVMPLPDAVVLRISGEDALTWLNGQMTCDLRTLAPGVGHYGLILTARGRILADGWASARPNGQIVLVVPASRLDELTAHFEKYVIMEDVEISQSDDEVVTVQGPLSAEVVAAAGLTGVACDRLGHGGIDVYARDAVEPLTSAAGRLGGGRIDEENWELARLRAARPRFGPDFGETTYPQEAGLAERAVSFEKGCYLGQEVICMLENRGQLTRRLVALEGRGELARGAALHISGASVGEVTSAVREADGSLRALGMLKRVHCQAGTVLEASNQALTVTSIVGSGS